MNGCVTKVTITTSIGTPVDVDIGGYYKTVGTTVATNGSVSRCRLFLRLGGTTVEL